MLVFEYRKAPFSIEAEKALDAGIKKIAAENTVINIYINVFIIIFNTYSTSVHWICDGR